MNKEEAIEILNKTKHNEGLFYIGLPTAIETVLEELEKKNDTCLHCGKGEPKYCEACYQNLISDNAKLQAKNMTVTHTDIHNLATYRGMDKIAEEICRND